MEPQNGRNKILTETGYDLGPGPYTTTGQQGANMKRNMITACLSVILLFFGIFMGCDRPEGPGWYKGDLHCHSTHSDGDSSVADVIAAAERRGLDFFVISDHDGSMGGDPSQWFDPGYGSDRMIMLYGVEWTTGRGHANVWAAEPFDYQPLWEAHQALDARVAIDAAHAQDVLFSINHPTDYDCCPWEYEEDRGVDSIEVWNGLYRIPDQDVIATHGFWDDYLMAGRRVPGVGGSDMHDLRGIPGLYLRVGDPTTWVYAEAATAEGVLAGIRAGRVSISHEPGAARLEFTADTDGDGTPDALMGDNVTLEAAREVLFEVRVHPQASFPGERAPVEDVSEAFTGSGGGEVKSLEEILTTLLDERGSLVLVMRNGRFHGLWKLAGDSGVFAFSDRVSPDDPVYYRVELLGRPKPGPINRILRGWVKALSNPIYFGYPD